MKGSGVSASFCASHYTLEGDLHGHTYGVKAWFRYTGDARDHRKALLTCLKKLDHTQLPNELAWGEDIGEFIGLQMLGCVRVEIDRDKEGFHSFWKVDPVPARGDPARSAELARLYSAGATYARLAELFEGTPQGVRSTIRKMIERSAVARR